MTKFKIGDIVTIVKPNKKTKRAQWIGKSGKINHITSDESTFRVEFVSDDLSTVWELFSKEWLEKK
jgi:hypothetical protein